MHFWQISRKPNSSFEGLVEGQESMTLVNLLSSRGINPYDTKVNLIDAGVHITCYHAAKSIPNPMPQSPAAVNLFWDRFVELCVVRCAIWIFCLFKAKICAFCMQTSLLRHCCSNLQKSFTTRSYAVACSCWMFCPGRNFNHLWASPLNLDPRKYFV